MFNRRKDALKKLGRLELIEIIYQLQQNEKKLCEENQALQNELNERRILMDEVGSIAQASLVLHDVFGSAQRAADQFVQEAKYQAEQIIFKAQQDSLRVIEIISDDETIRVGLSRSKK